MKKEGSKQINSLKPNLGKRQLLTYPKTRLLNTIIDTHNKDIAETNGRTDLKY